MKSKSRALTWKLGMLPLFAVGCAQPMMAVPPELGDGAIAYPVRGRQGLIILNPNIRFGNFRTDEIHRGITVGSGELEPGLISSTYKSEDHKLSTYSMLGWQARCVARSARVSSTEVTGVGISSQQGLYVEKETSLAETNSYACNLTGPLGQRLHLDLSSMGGSVVNEGGADIYSLAPVYERVTWRHPQLHGYLIESSSSGGVAFVQTSFDGVVFFSRKLTAAERSDLAVICVAVLLHEGE